MCVFVHVQALQTLTLSGPEVSHLMWKNAIFEVLVGARLHIMNGNQCKAQTRIKNSCTNECESEKKKCYLIPQLLNYMLLFYLCHILEDTHHFPRSFMLHNISYNSCMIESAALLLLLIDKRRDHSSFSSLWFMLKHVLV